MVTYTSIIADTSGDGVGAWTKDIRASRKKPPASLVSPAQLEMQSSRTRYALPRAAIIQLKHTLHEDPTNPEESLVRMEIDLHFWHTRLKIKDLRETRGIALLGVSHEFRNEYTRILHLSLPISYDRHQSDKGKLWFSNEDMLYCRSFFDHMSSISIDTTFRILSKQHLFDNLSRIAIKDPTHRFRNLTCLADLVADLMAAFPRVEEMKILSVPSILVSAAPYASPRSRFDYRGRCPDPDPALIAYVLSEGATRWQAEVLPIMRCLPAINSGRTVMPRISYL
ncbi:hypothetical protein VTL71DRAFT_1395 [Oculimacula yallundae]|uniref:Uncharacterized protein n=1 Tax=Oculimacula yallundae TaxID=86028 RepID=A0ABR4CAL7_9HELO